MKNDRGQQKRPEPLKQRSQQQHWQQPSNLKCLLPLLFQALTMAVMRCHLWAGVACMQPWAPLGSSSSSRLDLEVYYTKQEVLRHPCGKMSQQMTVVMTQRVTRVMTTRAGHQMPLGQLQGVLLLG